MKTLNYFKPLAIILIPWMLASCQKESELSFTEESSSVQMKSGNFPYILNLPDGFSPEGIEAGQGNDLYVGSLQLGSVYKLDRRTGAGYILVPQQTNRAALGLAHDARTNYLFVAGGPDGYAYVYDAATGADVAAYQLTTNTFPAGLINDVIVTETAAYFTNTVAGEMYMLPLGINGALPAPGSAQTIALSGDYTQIAGFNSNGIVANDDGSRLIICHTGLGLLYLVDPATGIATTIDLGGATVPSPDGMSLRGNTLYVVQNFINQISVVKLNGIWTSGVITKVITHPDYQIPTTSAISGNKIYAVNGKFDIAPPVLLGGTYDPTVPFEVVAVNIP